MRNENAAAAELERKFQEDELTQAAPRHRKINWSIVIGLSIISIITILAIIGPKIAPKDPVEEVMIIKIDDEWYVPPFPLFTPGYPLGSDQFGRDLWSRLLWGIRPTLIMVVIVAIVRLVIGVMLGLLSGWSTTRLGRFVDSLIEGAVAIPVLLVALGAIAIVGPEFGIWAFVIGLSLTGWVETAQQVREQTKIIKSQTYIEAARALGSSVRSILSNHVIRQIIPMILMLFAFELSSTLMTTAGLGFLGYYIGGDRYIEVSDFVVRRLSGMPELGQMLATSWVTLTKPWAMVAVGSTIFLTILGFNLIGEGMREGLDVVSARRSIFLQIWSRVGFWLDQHVNYPLQQVLARPSVRMATYGVLVVAFLWFGGVKFLWPKIETVMEGLPGSGPSAAFADAIASQTPVGTPALEATLTPTPVQVITNLEPEIIWEQQVADGFATGVTYDPAREVFYGVSTDNRLLAYSLEGELQWEAELPAKPFEHNPLLTSEGTILIADAAAGISAFSPEGQLIWHFMSSRAPVTTSGPVLSDSSTIYYVVSDYAKGYIQAVSTEGEDLWSLQTETSNFYYPLSLSQDGRYLFLREEVFDTAEQSSINIDTELIVTRYIGGQDGNIYMLSGQNLLQIDITQQPIEVLNSFEWDHQSSGVIFSAQQAPIQAVVSPDRTARFFYTSPGGSTSVVWLEIEPGLVGKVTAKFSGGSIVAEKDFDNLLVCGGLPFQEQALTCGLLSMEAEDPLWTIDLDQNGPALGGFWIEDTVYFSTANGMIYAISANGSNTTSSNPTAPQTGETVGIVWSKPLNEEIDFGPRQAADGSVTMFLDPPELLILNDDGSERIRTTLYKPWYETKGGRGESIVFYPQWLDDQFIVSVSQDPSVYAQDTDGNLLWEFPLENPPDDYPYLIDGKTLYVVDKKGLLYKFDASGLIWTFTPEVAELPASGLAVDPDGNIYYSLTNLAKGFLQAVSPDGEPLWNSEIHTSSFYDPILFSVDGNYLFIKDEIYRAEDGQFLDVDYGIPVAEFIVGEDGLNYLRSEQSIIQWELSPTGFQILHTAASPSIYPYSYRGRIEVDQNSIIWVYTFSAGGYDISYLSLDGMSIGEYHQQPADLIYKLDKKNLLIDLCQFSSEALSCGDFDPRTNSYSLETNISGIPDFLGTGWYASGEDFVFIHTRDDELFKVKLK